MMNFVTAVATVAAGGWAVDSRLGRRARYGRRCSQLRLHQGSFPFILRALLMEGMHVRHVAAQLRVLGRLRGDHLVAL